MSTVRVPEPGTRQAVPASPAGRISWVAPVAFAAAWMLLIWAIHQLSPRTLASFHGMLHAALVEVLLRPGGARSFPPENPFFAGEPVAYYWFYHALAAPLVRLLGINVFYALEALVVLSAGVLVLVAAALGRRLYRSQVAGLLLGFLVFAGANPLGVVFGAAQVARHGRSVLSDDPNHLWGVVHPVFSLIRFHDVGGLNGPLFSFFLNITSRPLALAGLLLTALCLHRALRNPRAREWVGLAGAFALTTAASPIIGIAAAGALGGAVLIELARSRYGRERDAQLGPGLVVTLGLALTAGLLVALPTFYHLLLGPSQSHAEVFLFSAPGLWHLASVVLSVGPLAGLAVVGLSRAVASERQYLRILFLAALLLLALNLALDLPDGNGSNTLHAAIVLLAVPAAGAMLAGGAALPRPSSRRAALIAAVFLPTFLALVGSYLFRPPLPASFASPHVERLPASSDLARLYQWARRSTPADAVFVIDPRKRVTVGGNVAEFPALSGRSILVEQLDHYLVAPYPDAAARYQLAIRLVSGEAAGPADRTRLAALHRPVFIASDHAGDPRLSARLRGLYGPPVFQQGNAAVYQVTGAAGIDQGKGSGAVDDE